MNNYTNEERVFMVKTFYSGVSLRRVRDLFAVAFNTRPIPSASTIQKYVEKFENQANISVESESRGGEHYKFYFKTCSKMTSYHRISTRG